MVRRDGECLATAGKLLLAIDVDYANEGYYVIEYS